MKVSGAWIDSEGAQSVLGLLKRAGFQAYVVGGCVRNALLDQPIYDIDMATDAVPDRVAELAADAGFKIIPTGIQHGTVTVVAGGTRFEVTTFRRDIETDGRRASVAYSDDISEDAARRDFTMNALYADADGTIMDPLGGLADLLARRVRFVGDAEARIKEDYLRILRFFRFHAWYGDVAEGMDGEALAACAANVSGLANLSRERVGHEVRRLLAAADPTSAMAAMQATGVLNEILPGTDIKGLGPLVHLEPPIKPYWLRRLAALGGASPVAALRLSANEAKYLKSLTDGLQGTAGTAELSYRSGADVARDVVLLRAALLATPMPEDWLKQVEIGQNARFPVAAADLMPDLTGAALGARLAELEKRWIDAGFKLSREQLLA